MANQVGKLIGRTPPDCAGCSQAGRETCGLGFYHFGHISHITAAREITGYLPCLGTGESGRYSSYISISLLVPWS